MRHAADLAILAPAPDGAMPEAARLVAVEPDPVRAASLTAAHPGLEVVDGMLAGGAGPATMIGWNLPGLRSLRAPNPRLRALFPGLREITRQLVNLVDPAALLAQLAPLPDHVSLHVDAPGEMAGIVDALENAGWLDRIAVLSLRCGVEPFFENEAGADEIAARLEAVGFREDGRNLQDPDFPVLHFLRDPARRTLLARVACLESEVGEVAAALEAERAAHGKTAADRDAKAERLAAAEKRAGEVAATLEAERAAHGKTAADRDATAEILAAAEKRAGEVAATLEAERAAHGKTAADRDARAERLAAVEKRAAGVAATLEAERAAHGKTAADRDATAERLAAAEKRAGEASERAARIERDAARHEDGQRAMHQAEGQIALIRDLLLRGPEP
jgi:hypothetical protein